LLRCAGPTATPPCFLQAASGSKGGKGSSSSKKKDAAGGPAPAAGDVEAASIEELHQKIQTLEKEKNKEEEYRNYMQLERVRAWLRVVESCAGVLFLSSAPLTPPAAAPTVATAGQDQCLLGNKQEGPAG
jgi:hypothetical protein